MLKFAAEDVVTLELAHRPTNWPVEIATGFSHLPILVDNLDAAIESLSRPGFTAVAAEWPGGSDGARVSWVRDPDGYRIWTRAPTGYRN